MRGIESGDASFGLVDAQPSTFLSPTLFPPLLLTQQELIQHGVPLSTGDKHDPSIPYKHAQAAAEEHEHRVLGGYKA